VFFKISLRIHPGERLLRLPTLLGIDGRQGVTGVEGVKDDTLTQNGLGTSAFFISGGGD